MKKKSQGMNVLTDQCPWILQLNCKGREQMLMHVTDQHRKEIPHNYK